MATKEKQATGMLADRLKAINGAVTQSRPCPFQRVLDSIDDDEVVTMLQAMIAGDGISAAQLARELTNSGYTIGRESVSVHRRQVCSCTRGA